METQTGKKEAKHYKSFWPIIVIFILGMVAGGLIFAFSVDNQLQDDINSMTFTPHYKTTKLLEKEQAIKKSTTTPVNK